MNWKKLVLKDPVRFNLEIEKVNPVDRIMFKGVDFSGLDLRHVHLHQCDLTEANLSKCKILGAVLSTCRLEKTILTDIIFDDVKWIDSIHEIQNLWNGTNEWNKSRIADVPFVMVGVSFS